MNTNLFIAALGLGLMTSFHCVGMCGPIALSMGLTQKQQLNFHLKNITYQLGRVVTYTFLGLLLGLIGTGFQLAGFQSYLTIFSGVVLVLMAIFSIGGSDFVTKLGLMNRFFYKIKFNLSKLLSKTDYSSKFLTGVLNGFLPCGMVYAALTASLAAGGVKESMLFMFLFGIGTVPLMFVVVLLGNMLSTNFRSTIMKLAPILMFALGSLFILRGLKIGIPYISPSKNALEIKHNHSKEHQQGDHSTCH